jgi:hypothetical protein
MLDMERVTESVLEAGMSDIRPIMKLLIENEPEHPCGTTSKVKSGRLSFLFSRVVSKEAGIKEVSYLVSTTIEVKSRHLLCSDEYFVWFVDDLLRSEAFFCMVRALVKGEEISYQVEFICSDEDVRPFICHFCSPLSASGVKGVV